MHPLKHLLSSALCICAASLISVATSSAIEKVPILVMQTEATVDGELRPQLGRSVTDSLTGGLLKTEYFTIIDYMSSEEVAAELSKDHTPRAPEQNAVRFGEITGAKYFFVPRMIVEEYYSRMSVKKIRVSDGEVLSVYECSCENDHSGMFKLSDDILTQIYKDVSRERALKYADERRQKNGMEREDDPMKVEPDPQHKDNTGTVEVVESSIVAPESTDGAPKAEEMESSIASEVTPEKLEAAAVKDEGNFSTEVAGTISAVNTDWRFCIINITKGGKVEIGEELRVLLDDPLLNVAKLKISKVEGRQVVADILTDIDPGLLKPGLRAFRWASTQ